MSDKKLDLTRRKVLGSLGAVGAAGAATGFGTTALFSDEESFVNNQITAGQLDLKVDWEEHYSFPQIYDAFDDPTEGGSLDVTRSEPDDIGEYTPLPDPQNPVVWVHDEDFEDYFANTIIEAFPDAPGDPVTASFDEDGSGNITQPCEFLADVPQDLGAYNDDGPARTRNGDTYDSANDEPLPLINLRDVKPGDFGELTLSTHLCFNDGYLWLSMPDGLTEAENGLEEPERTIGNDSTTGSDGELAENIQTALWYDDNCSNTIDGEPDPVIAMALIDTSNSIDSSEMGTIADASNAFVEQLNNVAQTEVAAGVMTFSGEDPNPGSSASIVLQNDIEELEPSSAYLDSNGNGQFDPGNNLLPSEGSGGTPLAPALDLAREVLNDRAETLINQSGNGFGPNTRKTILVLSDGLPTTPSFERYALVDPSGNDVVAQNGGVTNAPDDQFLSDVFDGTVDGSTSVTSIRDEAALVARDIDEGGKSDTGPSGTTDDPDISGADGVTLRTVGIGSQNVSDLNDFLTRVASDDGFFYNASLQGQDLVNVVDDIVTGLNVTGPAEKVIFRGTLEELAAELDPGRDGPIPLDGMPMTDTIDETEADPSAGPEDGRNCFDASSTHCFGFAWWVPIGVGNEIQGDSVSFDLQFLTEQCRNNEDPGQTVL